MFFNLLGYDLTFHQFMVQPTQACGYTGLLNTGTGFDRLLVATFFILFVW